MCQDLSCTIIFRKTSNNSVAIFIPIVQMRILRLKEVKCFARGHTANKGEGWKLNLLSMKDQHTLHCVAAASPQRTNMMSTIYRISVEFMAHLCLQLNIPEIGMHFINDSFFSYLRCGHGFSKNIKSTIPILCHYL